jgi:hypothetical protein
MMWKGLTTAGVDWCTSGAMARSSFSQQSAATEALQDFTCRDFLLHRRGYGHATAAAGAPTNRHDGRRMGGVQALVAG